jgi:nucleotidyltransferase substrate binding protein (TIGR01987 family)
MAIDYTPLANAVARLGEGLARFDRDRGDDQIRDGLIQRFEFTYDLAHKMLRRALEETSANPSDIDRLSFPDLIRTGVEQGLVPGEWAAWRTFRAMRNITSHTYDEAKALQVVTEIPAFLTEARGLLARLQARA